MEVSGIHPKPILTDPVVGALHTMESFHSGGTDRDVPLVLEEEIYDRRGKAK
jgi:hypothetical protein